MAGSELMLTHKEAGAHRCSQRVNAKFHKLCLPAADHGVNFAALMLIGYKLNKIHLEDVNKLQG